MLKTFLILIFSSLLFQKASAQVDNDTLFFYMKNSGETVDTKINADYYRVVMPVDSSTGINLYPVLDFYLDGKRKLTGASRYKSYAVAFEGRCMNFFPNGKKKSITTYKTGFPTGEIVAYYPNGKLYFSKSVKETHTLLLECRDSTGAALTENGNGKWIEYDDNLKDIVREGPVKDSLETGEWHGLTKDLLKYTYLYAKGEVKSGIRYDGAGKAYPFKGEDKMSNFTSAVFDVEPKYPGGLAVFYVFLSRMIIYPDYEKKNNIQGKVFVSFIVEADGKLSDVKAIRSGPSIGLANEAVRVIKLSKPWIPGSLKGKPVRVQYTVPVNFTISSDR